MVTYEFHYVSRSYNSQLPPHGLGSAIPVDDPLWLGAS